MKYLSCFDKNGLKPEQCKKNKKLNSNFFEQVFFGKMLEQNMIQQENQRLSYLQIRKSRADKRAGISKIFLLFFTLFSYIPWVEQCTKMEEKVQ